MNSVLLKTMSPTLTTFLFEIVNFLLLAGLLGWLFFKPVRKALEQQRESIHAAAQEAEQKLAEAERRREELDARRRAEQQGLEQLRNRELEAVRNKAEQIIADARAAAERERKRQAEQSARTAENDAARMSHAATAAAAEIVKRLLTQIDGPELQASLLRSACDQLRAIPRPQLAPLRVEAAAPLSADDRAQVVSSAGGDLGGEQIAWQVNSELGPGVRITTGQGVIDATADGLARFARRALLAELNHRNSNSAAMA